jgi:hypothetical protein
MSAEAFHLEALIFVIILVVYVLTSHVIENKKVSYIHESGIAIVMGMLTAFISKYVSPQQSRLSAKKSSSPMTCSSLLSHSTQSQGFSLSFFRL